jgi:tetratricopeptide (TPR) repeat protein
MDFAFCNGDNAFLAEVKSSCAWLALLREGSENLTKAEELLLSAWSLRKDCDQYVCYTIVINLAVLYTRKNDHINSDLWFKKFISLRKQGRGKVAPFNENRLTIRYLLYWGEKYYRDKDYIKAKRLYQQVIKKSEDIQWLRFKVKAYERLAFISIKENRMDDAENLLKTWYPVTERNRDYRRVAFFERDFARLEFERENYVKAKEWAFKALAKFKDLNMIIRVETVTKFIQKCDSFSDEH